MNQLWLINPPTTHHKVREVAIALSFNKGSPTRKNNLYHHNLTVLETGKEELIIKRRPPSDKRSDPDDFLPCEYCLAFIKQQELWKHMKSCKFKPEGDDAPRYQKYKY